MAKLEIKIHSWGEVTLNEYDSIMEICNDEGLSSAEKDIALIAILCGVEEKEVWNQTVENVNRLREDIKWVSEFNYPKTIRFNSIKVGKYDCNVDVNVNNMTIAQYVDFQTYFKDAERYKAELLSVFFIPKGHKYNDGYEISDIINEIRENVSILTYNSVIFFFLQEYQNSTKDLAVYLGMMMRKRARWTKRGKLRTLFKEMAKKMMEVREMQLLHGYT